MTNRIQVILDQISKYISIFGGVSTNELSEIKRCLPEVVAMTDDCLSGYAKLPNVFNIYQTQHSIDLIYRLARNLYLNGCEQISEKLYLVNRMVNGIDLFYKIELPKNFIFGHGLGTVLSRAKYGDYLVMFQNSTVGVNDGKYPIIGSRVVIFPNCVISGGTVLGNDCVVSAGSVLINEKIPDNSIVFCRGGGDLVIKENRGGLINDYFIKLLPSEFNS